MADTTNITVEIRGAAEPVIKYLSRWLEQHWALRIDLATATALRASGNDITLGSEDDVAAHLDQVLSDGIEDLETGNMMPVPPFGYRLWTDPAYEYLGGLRVRASGAGATFSARCDAAGVPFVDPGLLARATRDATSLDQLAAQIESMTGASVIDAFTGLPRPYYCPACGTCADQTGPAGRYPGHDGHQQPAGKGRPS